MTRYQHAKVDGIKIFYREAGSKTAPTILLLHGFPTSSHMFRNLMPALADRYHVVAPDLPGFGFSDAPDRKGYRYTFENLAKVIGNFTETIGLDHFAIYVFNYGAPVGLRLALAHPGTNHRHHLAERQCLRGRLEPGLEPNPEILEGTDGRKPCSAAQLSHA